jgi:hypothetical protein
MPLIPYILAPQDGFNSNYPAGCTYPFLPLTGSAFFEPECDLKVLVAAKVCPINSGVIVDLLDHVLRTLFSPALFISKTRFESLGST